MTEHGSPSSSTAPSEAARDATTADLDAVAGLAGELRAHTDGQRGGALWRAADSLVEPTVADLEARLPVAGLATLVGTLDGVVLAYGLAHTETLRDGRILAVIDELAVAEPARGVGLGETLLGALVTWATEHDAIGVDAPALPGDRTAKNFFETAGFTARRLVMYTSLS